MTLAVQPVPPSVTVAAGQQSPNVTSEFLVHMDSVLLSFLSLTET